MAFILKLNLSLSLFTFVILKVFFGPKQILGRTCVSLIYLFSKDLLGTNS